MSNENLLMNLEFEGRKLDYIIGEDGEPLFELYNVGMMLGYVVITKGKEYAREKRIDKVIENAEIIGVFHAGKLYLTEEMVYDFMLEAHTKPCKRFKKWLSKEVLPSIRKHGAYIGENADVNYINNELRFGNKTTIKTFANADPAMVNKLYDEFREYIDNEYKNNTNVRKSRYSSVEKGLTRLLKNMGTNVDNIGMCYNVQKLRYKVLSDTKILGNRINGGKRAGLTRQNNKLNKEINSLKNDIEALKPISFDDMVRVDNYAISKNDLNDPAIDSITGELKIINTREYKGWKWYFKNAMDKANIKQLFSHIDWSKPVEISYAVTCHENNDIGNFIDALQDVIQDYFHCDDRKFLVGTQLIVGIEPDKMKRKTYLYFRNVEESNLYVENGVVD